MKRPYSLSLTEEDIRTLEHVGDRYHWSQALWDMSGTPGVHYYTEAQAWELAEAFHDDTVGDHDPFPMLNGRSPLARKLQAFWDSIV